MSDQFPEHDPDIQNDPYADAGHQAAEEPRTGAQPQAHDAVTDDPYARAAAEDPAVGPHTTDAGATAAPAADAKPTPPPLTRKQKTTGCLTLLVIAALVVLGISACVHHGKKADEASPEHVGNCAIITRAADSSGSDKPSTVDCGSNTPGMYKVAATNVKTCEDPYMALNSTLGGKGGVDVSSTCYMPMLNTGTCYQLNDTPNQIYGYLAVDCSSSSADFRVAKVVDGRADTKLCGTDKGLAYGLDPKRTYCIGAPR